MTFWAKITKGVSMCVLDEITTGGVGKGATVSVLAKKIPIREYDFLGGGKLPNSQTREFIGGALLVIMTRNV